MKIVPIFVDQLYAFHYKGETDNEFDRNIELWTNPDKILKFAKTYLKGIDYQVYIESIIEEAELLIDLIDEISKNKTIQPEQFFEPLSEREYFVKIMPLQKGKIKRNCFRSDLRLYAIKIDTNCFVITGGAIKVSQTMQGNPLTKKELEKLRKCRLYLEENGVFDIDSFYELTVKR